MRLHGTLIAAASASISLTTSLAHADDWPAWRGPEGTGISTESAWSPQGVEKPLWTKNVGLGYTSFVVSGDRVITAGHNEDKGQDTIFCFNAKTGEQLWTHSFASKKWAQAHSGGTLSTPVIDGNRVFALTREAKFKCLDLANGKVVWQKNLKEEFDLTDPRWKFSASPLVDGDEVLLNVGPTIVFDKKTGKAKWKTDDTGHAYSTPQIMEIGGRRYIVVFNGSGLTLFDRSNGKKIAAQEWKTMYDVNAATPICFGNRIFISSGYNHGCMMLEFKDDALNVLWENKNMKNQMSGSVLFKGHLYGFDDATLKCLDLDGEEKWAQRGLGKGALMIADGKLIVNSSKGELVIANASPEGYQELSRTKVLNGGVYWTSPVLANGLIYSRNSNGDIACTDHRISGG